MDATTITILVLIGFLLLFLFLSNSKTSSNNNYVSRELDASHQHPEIKAKIIDQIVAGDFGSDDAEIMLRKNERLLIKIPLVSYCEERVIRRSGRSAGVSFRVARGLWIRTGGHNSANVEEITELDCGDLAITTNRLIFIGSSKSLEYSLSKIIRIDAADDQIAISRSGKQKVEYFVGVDKLTAAATSSKDDGNENSDLTFHIEGPDLKSVISRAMREYS